jgi:hypothetical protein
MATYGFVAGLGSIARAFLIIKGIRLDFSRFAKRPGLRRGGGSLVSFPVAEPSVPSFDWFPLGEGGVIIQGISEAAVERGPLFDRTLLASSVASDSSLSCLPSPVPETLAVAVRPARDLDVELLMTQRILMSFSFIPCGRNSVMECFFVQNRNGKSFF